MSVFSYLETHGERIALVLSDGRQVSYRELAAKADGYATRFSQRKGLLAIEMRNDIEPIAAYLGALRSRCPAILMAEGATGEGHPISDSFRPERPFVLRYS